MTTTCFNQPNILVEVEPVAFKHGSTLHVVKVNGKDHCCFVGWTATEARLDANACARELHRNLVRAAYDAIDRARRILGRPPVSRPNLSRPDL